MNPDFGFLEEISRLYQQTANYWKNDSGKDLEALGGGLNVTLEALQDSARRDPIAKTIQKCATCMDQVIRLLDDSLNE